MARAPRSPRAAEGQPLHNQPALPGGLNAARRALGAGWHYRIVFGVGSITVDKPIPATTEPVEQIRHVGKRKTLRKTAPTDVPVGSVSLRCWHDDGRRAVATWVWRSDADTWSNDVAYCWRADGDELPYQCSTTEFAELVGDELAAVAA